MQIAAEVAAPLARTEEIVLLGGGETTSGEITRLVGQVPPAVQALTGVDLSKVRSSPLLIRIQITRAIEITVFDGTSANFSQLISYLEMILLWCRLIR